MRIKTLLISVLSLLLAMVLVNCTSGNEESSSGEMTLYPLAQDRVISFVENSRPIDFPEGSSTAKWSEAHSAYVVSNQKSGCSILVKSSPEVKVDSEVQCSY